MVINRYVPSTPSRKPLGKLQLSIDDLDSLIELLAKHPDVSKVLVEFDGGDFTAGSDMKSLSDSDLRELRVRADNIVVHFSRSRAEAVGGRDLVQFVWDAWARGRQQRSTPPKTSWLAYNALNYIVVLGWGGIAAFLMHRLATDPSQFPGWRPGVAIFLVAAVFGGMIVFYLFNIRAARKQETWADILPVTAHELRERESAKSKVPRWTLVTAILAFLASSILGLLTYLNAISTP